MEIRPQSGKGTMAAVKGDKGTADNFKAGAHNAGVHHQVNGFGAGFKKSG